MKTEDELPSHEEVLRELERCDTQETDLDSAMPSREEVMRQEAEIWEDYQKMLSEVDRFETSTIYLSQKEISDWLDEKIAKLEKDININNIRYGAGKTFAICRHFSHLRNVGIFTDQHRHIDEEIKRMLTQNFGVSENEINHEKGFDRDCILLITKDKAIIDANHDKIERIKKFRKANVPPNLISKVECPSCQFKRECHYKNQFDENKIKNSINIAPFEFLGLKHNKNLDAVGCDELIDKWIKINYALEEKKINNLTEFSRYEASIDRVNEKGKTQIDKEAFRKDLDRLKELLLKFNEKIKTKSVLNKFNFKDELTNPDKKFIVEEVNNEDEFYYLVMHPDKILDLDNTDDEEFLHNFYSLFFEYGAVLRYGIGLLGMGYTEPNRFCKNLQSIQLQTIRDVNLVLFKNIQDILNLPEVLIYSFLEPIQINEKIVKVNSGYESEIGKIYGDKWDKKRKSWFVYDRHQLWDMLELAKSNSIVWAVASFDKDKFKIILDDFNRYQWIKSTLVMFEYRPLSFVVHEDIEKELGKRFPPYKAKIFNVKRIGGGSFSRTALKEYQKELIEYLRFLITKDPVGWNISTKTIMIGYHNLCHKDKEGWKGLWVKDIEEICEKYRIKIEDFWKWWLGSGLPGSNFGKDRVRLIMIGDPRPPQEEYILEHVRLFKEIPNGLFFGAKKTKYPRPKFSVKKTRISDEIILRDNHTQIGFTDGKLNFIFKLLVIDKKNDALHRLRDLYTPKEIFNLGILTDYAKSNFEVEDVFLPKIIIEPILEDHEMVEKIKNKVENEGLSVKDGLIPKAVFHAVMENLSKRFNWVYDQQDKAYRLKKRRTRLDLMNDVRSAIPRGDVISFRELRRRTGMMSDTLKVVLKWLKMFGEIEIKEGHGGGIKFN